MANSEGSGGQAPAAWVWSHYRGVISETRGPDSAPAPAEPFKAPVTQSPATQTPAAEGRSPAAVEASKPEDKGSALIGVGVAAAVLVIAGLTWLFTTQPASSPAPAEAVPAASENTPAKSETAPPVATPAPAAAPEAAKSPAPAAHDHPGKKKKR